MADLKTTNIYGDAYVNNKVGINTTTPATRLQIGQLSPTAATEGIQFGDDTSTRIYRGASGQINFNGTINVLGNTYLGDANGDTVFVNDTIRIGATDSGDASLFFGEGSVAGSDYGARWYWDSGYTFYWYTRNAGTDTQLFNYVTNDLSYVNWNRNFNMQNYAINYNSQIHFNAGTRFVGNNTQYLIFRSDATSLGGIQIKDGSDTLKGYIGYWDSGGGGILNNTGNWAVRYNFGNANSGGTLYGDWTIAGLYTTGDYEIRNASPTITFRDTDHRTGFIHVNSNIFYVLTGVADSARGNWAQVANSRWPLEINLSNNNATFGGDVNAISFSGPLTGNVTGNASTATTLATARTLTIGSTGKTFNGSADITWSLAEIGASATNQTMYIGTTAVAINRSSANLALTGITSIDGNAATVTGITNQSSANTDLNTLTTSGFYRLSNAAPNDPTTNKYGQLLVIRAASDTITQIIGDYGTGTLYTRSGNPSNVGGTGAYTAWRTLVYDGGTWSINTSGNAATATTLATARAINGVNFNGSAAITVNGLNYNVNDNWLRENGDDAQFQMYGNSRTMIYRTDGTTNPHGGGAFAHIFYYGGSADGNRMFIINTDGRLWSTYHGWLDTMSTTGNSGNVTIGNLASQLTTSATLAAGAWYTIAVNAGDRASAKFTVSNEDSGLHQCVQFYATSQFASGNGAKISVISNTYYGGPPIGNIRIMKGSTYDGAMVQVYLNNTCSIKIAIYDNQQSGGWTIKNGIVSTTNPGGVNTFASLTTNAAEVDLNSGKSFSITDDIYIGGGTTQYKALHANNYTDYTVTKTGGGASGNWGINITGNAATATSATSVATLTTARTITVGSTGRSFNGSADISWTLSDIGAAATNGATNQNFSANAIYPYEWIRFKTDSGIYWETGTYAGWHIYPQTLWGMSFRSPGTDCGLQLRRSNNVVVGSVYSDGTSIGFLDASNGWGASWTLAGVMNRGSVPGSLVTGNISGNAATATSAASCTGNAATATSISGYNNPTTAATVSTIAYRDANADLTTRYFLANRTTAAAGQCGIQLQTGGTSKWWMYLRTNDDANLVFYTSNSPADDVVRMSSTGMGVKIDPSNRLHVNGPGTSPAAASADCAVRIDNTGVVLAATVGSNGRTFYGWLPISVDGTLRWIRLFS